MASRVHYAMESMISELLELKKEFGERKVKNLVKKIQEFEYKSMDSLQSYIEFTCCLYKLMEKRGKKLTAITARIHGLYQKLLRNGNDPQLWVQYLNWQRDKSPKLLGKNYAKAIQLFPTSSTFWLMASKHEYTNGNWQSARVLMQRSLRFCANDEKLWLELFKLEILYVEMLAGRRKVLGIAGSINVPTFDGESSDSDQALVADSIIENGKLKLDFILAQTVFKNACRQNPSLEFVLKFLSLVLNMNLEANLNKTELLDDIYSELKQFDCDQAGTITCLRPLQVIDIPSIDYDSHDFPVKVALCVKLFKESNIALDYAKFLQHVYQSGESNLQKYCLFYLNELYVSSLNAGTLTSELILCVYQTIGDSAILDSGLKTINGDCDLLWNEKVAMVGGSGIQDLYLQNKQVRCVKLAYFDWLIENSTEQQVASFFNNECFDTKDNIFITKYLDYASRSPLKFRQFVNKLLKSITNPIEYVKKAIDIELAIDTSMKDVGQITMLFEVLHQLDKSNVEFWIKHLEFELKERVENCSGLYWRASKCCDEQELAVKYSQLQQ